MIQVDLRDERVLRAWKNLSDPNMEYIESDGFTSLLESALKQRARGDNLLTDLSSMLDRIRAAMTHFWRDSAINFPLIAKKDITHNQRILFYLDSLLFPIDDDESKEQISALYPQLDEHDVFVLLCSVYIHDYGKGQFRLIVPELPTDHPKREVFKNAPGVSGFPPETYDLLEQYHTHTISKFIGVFLKHTKDHQLIEALEEKYGEPVLPGYFQGIQHQPLADPTDAATGQQQLYWVLWKIANIPNIGQRLLKDIQIICRSHKECRLLSAGQPQTIDYFDRIGKESKATRERLRLLAALLRTGDNLDLTRARLQTAGELHTTFNDWLRRGTPASELPETFERLFSKWATFAAVQKVAVRHHFPNVHRQPTTEVPFPDAVIEITLTYTRFANWQKYFLALRELVEKDFFHCGYLDALRVGNTDQRVDIRLTYEVVAPLPIQNTADDHNYRLQFSGVLSERFGFRYPSPELKNLYRLTTPASEPASLLTFSPLSKNLPLPANHTMLYLLAFLDSCGGRASCETIARRMGLGEVRYFPHRKDIVNDGGILKVDDTLVEIREDARCRVGALLQAFREHPTLLRSKVGELEYLGHLLPFSLREVKTIPTGIDGLDKILKVSRGEDPHGGWSLSGFEHARNILVVGGPGTGKTTLLLQILHYNLHFAQRNVLMLTFEEFGPVLSTTERTHFGWDLDFVRYIQLEPKQNLDALLARIYDLISYEDPDLVAIDGLSRLRWADREHYRDVIDALFKALQTRGITSFSSIEDPAGDGPAEEYQADGVIHLVDKNDSRQLRIRKLRSQDYISGLHAFEILDRSKTDTPLEKDRPFRPGINVYPNEQYYASASDLRLPVSDNSDPEYLPTGVEGLDRLLPGKNLKQNGYRPGEAILVLGSPGAGKTLFGLHFLKAGLGKASQIPSVLWLSFEGPLHLLKRSVNSFDDSAGFKTLLGNPEEFIFEFVPPALISPEKVLFQVDRLVKDYGVRRIVIDSVSEIQTAFRDPVHFRQYMTTFIHTLARSEVTSMFLYRVPGFFLTARESESDIATLVDTIISIKTFDMKNRVRRGLFVLKSRGREHRSQLQTMEIHPKHGIQVFDKGWEMQGLLSGETGDIYEPEVFLKHFYENRAEYAINTKLVREFGRRYKEKGQFTAVKKAAVSSEFWSFRGHHGAGHANIRVISINRYMVEAFREREARLHTLEEFFPEHLREQMEKDVRWNRYATPTGGYDSIPMYTDMGFLVVRSALASELLSDMKDVTDEEETGLLQQNAKSEVSWEILVRLAEAVSTSHRVEQAKKRPFVFALPYLYNQTEFMAFFFEILWSQGGDVYHFPIFDEPEIGRDTFYKQRIYFNKHVWEKFDESLGRIKEQPGLAFYSLRETCKRLHALSGFFGLDPVRDPDQVTKGELQTLLGSIVQGLRSFIKTTILSMDTFVHDSDVITINNIYGRRALSFLYNLVFGKTKEAIPNPYFGEFRPEAVFSRHWYSQIEEVRKGLGGTEESVSILPLPYFCEEEEVVKEEGAKERRCRRRSCTCETVWCLSLVREALSPEIGWIYIDTLTSWEWTEERSKLRLGFPYRLEEIKPMSRHDPQAYDLLNRITENKRRKDRVSDAQQKLTAPGEDKDFNKASGEFFSGKYHDRDIGDVLAYFAKHPGMEESAKAFLEHLEGKSIDIVRIQEHVKENRVSWLSDFEDFGSEVSLRSKLPAHRPWFHRVEAGLHDEIVKLFSPEGRRDWYSRLYSNALVVGMEDTAIDEGLAKMEETLIETALERMHDRLIFDLLTALPIAFREQWPSPQKAQIPLMPGNGVEGG